jgi:hypothetical protein
MPVPPGSPEDASATHDAATPTDVAPADVAEGPDVVVPEADDVGGEEPEEDAPREGAFDRMVERAHHLRGWVRGLIAFVLYAIAAVAVWATPILSQFDQRYLGDGYWDSKFYQWAIGWMHWSVAHHADPLYTHKIFTPDGTSLVWSAFAPAGGLAMYPIRSLFGSLVATNVLLLLSSALACWGAYLVCNRITHAFWPSLMGGYLFGFSQYMVGQLHGHVNLVLIFPVPIAVYLVIRRIEGSMGRVTFLMLTTLTLVTLFLCSTELFATAALFGAIAFVIAMIAARKDWRRVLDAGLLTFGAFVASAAILSPYLIAAVQNERPEAVHDLAAASSDALSFVVPTNVNLFTTAATERWSSLFLAKSVEDAGYVSIALVAMLVWFAISERRRAATWGLLAFVAVVSVAAIGPVLHVKGTASTGMPWGFVADLPLIGNAIPARFPAYSALAIGVIAAMFLARAPAKTAVLRWIVVLAGLALLYPNVDKVAHVPQTVPAFFTDGTYRSYLQPDEVVFAIPKEKAGEMLWQDAADFDFRLAQGYLGPLPAQYAGEPLNKGLYANQYLNPDPSLLAAWLNERGATVVVLADQVRSQFETTIRAAGGRPVFEGDGVSLWRPPTLPWSAEAPG